MVAGFPLDGPYRLDAARVRDVLDARGADIYGEPGTVREVYSLYARVQPGNSGGPLLSPDGSVVGIVFAKSLDDESTGYALTLDEAAPVLRQARNATAAGGHRRLRRGLSHVRGRRSGSAEPVEPAGEVGVDRVRRLLGQEVPRAGDDVLLVRAGDVGRRAARARRAPPRRRGRPGGAAPAP